MVRVSDIWTVRHSFITSLDDVFIDVQKLSIAWQSMYFYYNNSQKIVTSFHLMGYLGCNLKMPSGESLFLFSGHFYNTKYIDCHVNDHFCTSIFNNHALTIIQFLNIWLCRFCSVSIHCSDMSFCVMGCAIVRRMS